MTWQSKAVSGRETEKHKSLYERIPRSVTTPSLESGPERLKTDPITVVPGIALVLTASPPHRTRARFSHFFCQYLAFLLGLFNCKEPPNTVEHCLHCFTYCRSCIPRKSLFLFSFSCFLLKAMLLRVGYRASQVTKRGSVRRSPTPARVRIAILPPHPRPPPPPSPLPLHLRPLPPQAIVMHTWHHHHHLLKTNARFAL